jgi:hypothetical protein
MDPDVRQDDEQEDVHFWACQFSRQRSPVCADSRRRRPLRVPSGFPISNPIICWDGTPPMTTFDERERAFENKFAHDEEMMFRITARRNRLLGAWAADLMKLTPEEADAYSKAVVQAEFEESGDEDVVRKLYGDLVSANVEIDEPAIRAMMEDKLVEARRQLLGSI